MYRKHTPITKKPIAAISFKSPSGIIVAIEPPARAPIRLARTSAEDEPINTARGLFEDPLIATVASCVLSPSSARNMVIKVEANSEIDIYAR